MTKKDSIRNAGIMLIIKDGLILAVSRGLNSNKWGLIGGKSEPGETPEQTAIREVKEESGITVSKCKKIYCRLEHKATEDGMDFFATTFYATEWAGEPRDSEEGNVKWVTADVLASEETGAFPQYNKNAIWLFTKEYPKVILK
jgi:mutator protein MutT